MPESLGDPGPIQLTITSPPYNVKWSYGPGYKDDLPLDDYLHLLTQAIARIYDCTRPGGVLCLNLPPSIRTAEERSFPLAAWAELEVRKSGWNLRESIEWVKSNAGAQVRATTTAIGNYKNPFIRHCRERIIIASRGPFQIPGRSSRWPGDNSQWTSYMELCKDVWLVNPGRAPKGRPLRFPEKLVSGLIYLYSNIGDTILDPFAGTGSVGEIARRMGRDCVLCELNPALWPELELITDQLSIDNVLPANVPAVELPPRAPVYSTKGLFD